MTTRQVQRLLKAFRAEGAAALRHEARGRPYQKRSTKPGRRADFMNDPAVIARREQAIARMEAGERLEAVE